MTAAIRNSALFSNARSQPRHDSVQPVMAMILEKARGREFTTGDASIWTSRAPHEVVYAMRLMVDGGLISITGASGRQNIYRAVT